MTPKLEAALEDAAVLVWVGVGVWLESITRGGFLGLMVATAIIVALIGVYFSLLSHFKRKGQ